jgi:signal transduction histidine kinase
MFQSTFLRRIILIIILALSISALLTTVLFTLASSQSLELSRQTDLLERAYAIADHYALFDGEFEEYSWNDLVSDHSFVGAQTYIYDSSGKLITQSVDNNDVDNDFLVRVSNFLDSNLIQKTGEKYNSTILTGNSINSRLMIIQVPLMSKDSKISGYVVMADPLIVVTNIQQELLRVMLLATMVASSFMLIPVYFISRRLVKPLRDVNEVALAFGNGDFSVRADSTPKGEIGELAVSFNSLADQLSTSIYELTVERNRLREIFDVISEGIVSVDLDLRPVYSNPAIHTLFENSKKRNLFTNRLQLIPFDEVWEDFSKCIKEGVTLERTLDERENAYLSTIVPTFDNNRQVVGATGFFRDISESERLEQTRRDYVANVSHELRTPLTALRGLVEPLADGMVKNETDRMRYYGIILHETMRLSRLIDDMLELSRLQARTIAFKTFPFDLNSLLSELKDKFTPVMEDAELTFDVVYKSGPCPTVMGNPDRVEQILVILMDNAKKYTPPGGSILISTELNEKDDQVLVSVIDTGQGIHEYDIDHIFDRFYKADRARGKKGTGLGLSIARELLSYMGETISVQSEYGEGTTFTFTLKCVRGTVWF